MADSGTHVSSDVGAQQYAEGLRAGLEQLQEQRQVDNSSWDGPAAMSACADSDDPAACYRAICAGRKAGDPDTQNAHALPHHKTPDSPPNAAGVRNALSRLPQTQGLTNRQAAESHLEAHLREVQGGRSERPPRDMLVRSQPDFTVVERAESDGMPTMVGHLAVFNRWTEIRSLYEGHFLERIAPSAFAKAIGDWRSNPNSVRVTFNHGKDPQLGDKVLGIPERIEEDEIGVAYAVPLFDTSYNRDLVPGLMAGAYGASFRFRVPDAGDDWIKRPGKSEHNPAGLPERTIKAVAMTEFGPVTYPQYIDATAGVRSLTDDYIRMVLGNAPSAEAAPVHLEEGSKASSPVKWRPVSREAFIESLRR